MSNSNNQTRKTMKKKTFSFAFIVILIAVSTNATYLHAQRPVRSFDKDKRPTEKKLPASPGGKGFLSSVTKQPRIVDNRSQRPIARRYEMDRSPRYRGLPSVRINQLPYGYRRINHRGSSYFFADGLFYSPFGSYYRPVVPPMGIRLSILPRGYWSFNYGGFPYFYYSGIFYRSFNNEYQVVDPPVGALVPSVPTDANISFVEGQRIYEYNGIYYKEEVGFDGRMRYRVEGREEMLDTETESERPAIGDIVDQLPSQVKSVVINGKKLFVTPDNVYYEAFVDEDEIRYRVVGN